jgi:hypothetical protein
MSTHLDRRWGPIRRLLADLPSRYALSIRIAKVMSSSTLQGYLFLF